MAKQDLRELGFRDDNKTESPGASQGEQRNGHQQESTDEEQGFVAGLKRFKK